MTHPLGAPVRYTLPVAVAIAAVAALVAACLASSGGSLGDPCTSAMDCRNQFECLALDDAGTCSSTQKTCQQTCADNANCAIVGTTYTCTPLKCAGPGNSGVCQAH